MEPLGNVSNGNHMVLAKDALPHNLFHARENLADGEPFT